MELRGALMDFKADYVGLERIEIRVKLKAMLDKYFKNFRRSGEEIDLSRISLKRFFESRH